MRAPASQLRSGAGEAMVAPCEVLPPTKIGTKREHPDNEVTGRRANDDAQDRWDPCGARALSLGRARGTQTTH